MQNFETLLTYENNGIDFSDIHSLSQGKYVTVGISQDEPDQSTAQESIKNLASYAKQEAKGFVCDAAEAAAEGFPVCGTIKFFTDMTSGFWDLFQDTSSSISGNYTMSYPDLGTGGNVNSVTMQLYDPYNFPAVNLFEGDGCTGQSMAFGVRNFTVSGTTNDPVFTEIPKSTYSLIYPALNANSIWIPPYTEVESF